MNLKFPLHFQFTSLMIDWPTHHHQTIRSPAFLQESIPIQERDIIRFLQDTGKVYGHPAHWITFFLKVKSWEEWKQNWYYIPSSYSIPKTPQGSQCATLLGYYESLKKTLTSYIPAHSLKLTHLQWGPWLTLLVLHPIQRGVNSIKSGRRVQGQPQGSEAPL